MMKAERDYCTGDEIATLHAAALSKALHADSRLPSQPSRRCCRLGNHIASISRVTSATRSLPFPENGTLPLMIRILAICTVIIGLIIGLVLFVTGRRSEDRPPVGNPDAAGSTISDAPAPPPAPTTGTDQASLHVEGAATAKTVAPPPLPKPAVTTNNPALQRFVDTSDTSRFGGDFMSLVPTISDPNDIAWVLYVLRDHTDMDVVRNEAANLLSRSQVPGLDEHLLAVLASPHEKPRFLSYAVQHLGNLLQDFRTNSTVETVARERAVAAGVKQALQSPHVEVRSEALLILARERDPQAARIIRSQLAMPATDYPQELLINCAKDAELRDLIPSIRPLAYAENPVVRIAAIHALAQWRDEVSRPAFEEASRSAVARLTRAGALALSLLDQPPQ